MIIPIRCMSCSKVIGDLWETYKKERESIKSKTSKESKNAI